MKIYVTEVKDQQPVSKSNDSGFESIQQVVGLMGQPEINTQSMITYPTGVDGIVTCYSSMRLL